MKKYIYFKQELEIRTYPSQKQILYVNTLPDNSQSKDGIKGFFINNTAIEIIELIDGMNTYDDVVQILANRYKESIESINEKVSRFLETLKSQCNIEVGYSDRQCMKNVKIKYETNKYPIVSSIELTHKCNLKCLHCYGEFNDKYNYNKDKTMSLDNVKKLLRDLKDIGVRIIEFTGGDITMHPNLKEILLEAIELNFKQIALLTNGIALSDDVINIIIKNKKRFIVQIDLHSLDDDYLYWFTNRKNTLDIIKDKINTLNNGGVLLRIVTVVTQKNLCEIENIADYVYNLGVKFYAVSPVINIGRAIKSNENNKCNDDGLLLRTEEEVRNYEKQILAISEKYPGFLNLIEDPRYSSPNCGALTSNITITPDGYIKLCTMDNLEYFKSSIGNVFTQNIKEIYDENAEFLKVYESIKSPEPESEECIECTDRFFCGHCMLRGIIKAKEKGGKCKWFKKNVKDVVKQRFLL